MAILPAPKKSAPQRYSMDSAPRKPNTLFRRVSAQAMGMAADALCDKAQWVPKGTRSHCANCAKAFGLWSTKHNCRLCGDVVCGPCSTKRILFQGKSSVRACDECVHANVRTISARNRRSSIEGGALRHAHSNSSSNSSGDDDDQDKDHPHDTHPREDAFAYRRSEWGTRPTRGMPLASVAEPSYSSSRERDASATEKEMAKYVSARSMVHWRRQLPYAVVLLLVVVAGVTNLVMWH